MSVVSDILTIDLAQKLNICEYSEICKKQTAHGVNGQNQIIYNHATTPFEKEKSSQNRDNRGASVATCTDKHVPQITTRPEQPLGRDGNMRKSGEYSGTRRKCVPNNRK